MSNKFLNIDTRFPSECKTKDQPSESITHDWQSIIRTILSEFSREMESYSYYGSNRGIPEDMYEDVADVIIKSCYLK